jgi:hypothetical protein
MRILSECSSNFFFVELRSKAGHGLLILRFLDHTQRRTTLGRTHLDEWSARPRGLYLTTRNTQTDKHPCPRLYATYILSKREDADLRLSFQNIDIKYQTTRRHIPQVSNWRVNQCENSRTAFHRPVLSIYIVFFMRHCGQL